MALGLAHRTERFRHHPYHRRNTSKADFGTCAGEPKRFSRDAVATANAPLAGWSGRPEIPDPWRGTARLRARMDGRQVMACLQINIEGLGTFRGCKSFTAKGSRAIGEFAGDDIGSEHH